jgi:cytochrome c biogenesis protein CcdA
MIDAPLAWAFTAGLVATVNPCGFAMLPAYLSYFVGRDDDGAPAADRHSAVGRALATGVVVSLGFLLVFSAVGGLVSAGLRSVVDAVPWISIVIGALLALLGAAMIAGFRPTVRLPHLRLGGSHRGLPSMFLFGISYAVASLSCTLPIFLAVVAGTITRGNVASGLLTFLAYGAGMSLVLLTLTLALALAKGTIVDRLRGGRRYVSVASGALLVVAGGYIVYYWTLALAAEPGDNGWSGASTFVAQLSGQVASALGRSPLLVGLVLGSLVAAALVYVLLRRLVRRRPPEVELPRPLEVEERATSTGAR